MQFHIHVLIAANIPQCVSFGSWCQNTLSPHSATFHSNVFFLPMGEYKLHFWMDGLAWWASLLSTTGIRLNTAYLHTTRIEFIQCAGKSLFLAYSGRIMSFWFIYLFSPCLFGFLPTLRIFRQRTFICKLINDLHLTARYEKMRAHCSSLQIGLRFHSPFFPMRKVKSPRRPQGCWPPEFDAKFSSFRRKQRVRNANTRIF